MDTSNFSEEPNGTKSEEQHADVQTSRASEETSEHGDVSDAEKGLESAPESRPDGLKKTVTAQDWTGPDDPENPLNWPLWQRVYHTTVPALFGFAITFGTSVYTPGFWEVMSKFGVSQTVSLLPLALYTLGLAFGPMLAAPVSETRGRRLVYLFSLPVAALFILGSGFSHNFASLAICRFFAGFFGSPVLAVGAGTNVDLWRPVHRAAAIAGFLLVPFLGPAVGPAVGGFAAEYKGVSVLHDPTIQILNILSNKERWLTDLPVALDTMDNPFPDGSHIRVLTSHERNLQKNHTTTTL